MITADVRTMFHDLSDRVTRCNLADYLWDRATPETEETVGWTVAHLRNMDRRVFWRADGTVGTVPTPEQCAGWNAHDIAQEIGIGYSGDCNAIDHGGYFYDTRDWIEHGYASCVEFYRLYDDEDTLYVQQGTIHREEDPERMRVLFDSADVDWEEYGQNVHAQIELCRDYDGIEPDSYVAAKKFRGEWKEARIWKMVLPWLLQLAQ